MSETLDPRLVALAVERGIISSGQAESLVALAREQGGAPIGGNEDEQLRLVSGFGDIFVTLGLVLFLSASGYFLGSMAGETAQALVLAVMSWGLAEFFTRRQRMALPSILLLVVFAVATFFGVLRLAGATTPGYGSLPAWILSRPVEAATAAGVTAVLVGVHYWRFRVPITVAAGVAALVMAALGLLFAGAPDQMQGHFNAVLFGCGLVVFALAMVFDGRDPMRRTRRTDIAFWLHMLASPLIVHPLVAPLVRGDQARDLGAAGLVLVVFVALGLVAVVVDRRAMLVSGLAYAGIAFGTIAGRYGVGYDRILPATLLCLGAFVLLLSAGWKPLRQVLLRALPDGLARRLPHPAIDGPLPLR